MAKTGATGKFWLPTHDWHSKKIVEILAVLFVLKIFFHFSDFWVRNGRHAVSSGSKNSW
jgi:hypothetical protein